MSCGIRLTISYAKCRLIAKQRLSTYTKIGNKMKFNEIVLYIDMFSSTAYKNVLVA
jgi:hypothetical protein